MMANINAYELLGLNERASIDDVRSAYLQKAKLYHPDCGGKAEDFLNVKKAYEILSDFERRELMGRIKNFKAPLMRLQPSQGSSLDQLLRNLDVLKDKLGTS